MVCRQEIIGLRGSLSNLAFAAIITGLLLAGCTQSASTPDVTLPSPQGDPVLRPWTEAPGGDGADALPVEDDAADSAAEVSYPSDDEGDDPVGMIVTGVDELSGSLAASPWLVTIRLFRQASEPSIRGDATVELTRYAEDFPIAAHIRFFTEPLDTCVVRNGESEAGTNQSDTPPPGIDGGETVVLNTPSGPWLSLEQTRMPDGQQKYLAQDSLPGTLPAGATLSIPGGAFPTVAAYPLFETEPVVRLLPAISQPITAESRYSWIPLNKSTHVKIDFMAHDEEGGFQGYPVSCWVRDDGSFDLPGEVLEALEPLDMQVDPAIRLKVRYSRVYSRVDLVGGIVFHQVMEIAE